MTLLEIARTYRDSGLSLVPVSPTDKKPVVASWKTFQERKPTDTDLRQWFATGSNRVGIICGDVSGGLETLDFDEAGLAEEFIRDLQGLDLDLFERVQQMPFAKTPSGGAHLRYRCAVCEGNQKLALTSDGRGVRIETRGEGGYAIAPPSSGYTLVQGDLTQIPEISPNEREILHACARLYDLRTLEGSTLSYPEPKHEPASESIGYQRPGDDYNERGDVITLLQQHGWHVLTQRGEVYQLRKPSSHSRTLHATFGYRGRWFYVFSSVAAPFDSEKGYSPFSCYAILECAGDFVEASRRLSKEGFGIPLSERPSVPNEQTERLAAIVKGNHDSDPEEEEQKITAVIFSNLKNGTFCEKNETEKPISETVFLKRGRRLAKEKKDFDTAWSWAVGEWYNLAVSDVEHGQKERIARAIFGEALPTVKTYAYAVRSWERDGVKPCPNMSKNVRVVLGKAPKAVKEEVCREWANGNRFTAEQLREKLEEGGHIPKREKPVDAAKIALEKIAALIGHEKLCEIGEECLRDGDTPEFKRKLAALMSQNANLLEQQAHSLESTTPTVDSSESEKSESCNSCTEETPSLFDSPLPEALPPPIPVSVVAVVHSPTPLFREPVTRSHPPAPSLVSPSAPYPVALLNSSPPSSYDGVALLECEPEEEPVDPFAGIPDEEPVPEGLLMDVVAQDKHLKAIQG